MFSILQIWYYLEAVAQLSTYYSKLDNINYFTQDVINIVYTIGERLGNCILNIMSILAKLFKEKAI